MVRFRSLNALAAMGLKTWQNGGTSDRSQLKEDYLTDVKAVSNVGHIVRDRLGLPPA
jgi:hypothetical protein